MVFFSFGTDAATGNFGSWRGLAWTMAAATAADDGGEGVVERNVGDGVVVLAGPSSDPAYAWSSAPTDDLRGGGVGTLAALEGARECWARRVDGAGEADRDGGGVEASLFDEDDMPGRQRAIGDIRPDSDRARNDGDGLDGRGPGWPRVVMSPMFNARMSALFLLLAVIAHDTSSMPAFLSAESSDATSDAIDAAGSSAGAGLRATDGAAATGGADLADTFREKSPPLSPKKDVLRTGVFDFAGSSSIEATTGIRSDDMSCWRRSRRRCSWDAIPSDGLASTIAAGAGGGAVAANSARLRSTTEAFGVA